MRIPRLALGLILATACAGPQPPTDSGTPAPRNGPAPADTAQAPPPAPPADAAPAPDASRAAPPGVSAAPVASLDLICEVSCSQTKLRTGVATVSWAVPPGGATRARQEHALDMTVFSEGFETGTFARLYPLERGKPFIPVPQRGPAPTPPPAAFNVSTAEVRPAEEQQRVVVRIEGLEPGLNYFWRVASPTRGDGAPSQTVSCMAPVCPADMQQAPRP